MKEKPILFSGQMVRAIIDRRKTQTRRIVKPQPDWIDKSVMFWRGKAAMINEHRCPYGQPGDRIWVRESHAPAADCWGRWERSIEKNCNLFGPGELHYKADSGKPYIDRWRPSIHMPRWASRITLEITGVRIERLCDIDKTDSIAEGCAGGHGAIAGYTYNATPIEQFRALWDSINAKRAPWASNPWVWVIEFRRIKS